MQKDHRLPVPDVIGPVTTTSSTGNLSKEVPLQLLPTTNRSTLRTPSSCVPLPTQTPNTRPTCRHIGDCVCRVPSGLTPRPSTLGETRVVETLGI